MRPDLRTMFEHGAVLADDALVDLVGDAVRYYAATLRFDGSVVGATGRLAAAADIDERIAAALLGCGDAFRRAADRYGRPG